MLNYRKYFSAKEDGREEGQGSSQASYKLSDVAAATPTIKKALNGKVSEFQELLSLPTQKTDLSISELLTNCIKSLHFCNQKQKSFNGRYLRGIHMKYEYEKYWLFLF